MSTNIRLMHGDCIEEMQKLAEEGVVVDLVLTDPPYGTTACMWDSVIPLDQMWSGIKSLLKPTGAAVLFGAEPFISCLITSNLPMFKYDLIWHKPNGTGFLDAKRKPLRNHEHLAVFSEAGRTVYNPQKWHGEPYTAVRRGRATDVYAPIKNTPTINDDGLRYPNSIIFDIPNAGKKKLHPTQKPVLLMEYLIKTYSNAGNTVLDFTMGSGSTGVACINTGRNFIGIEKDAKYFDVATQRIAERLKNS